MKKTILAIAISGLALAIVDRVEKYRAHREYNKGFNDGAKLAFAVKDLEYTLDKMIDNL